MKQDTTSNDNFDSYYRSIIDMQFSTRMLYTVATEIHNNEDDLSPTTNRPSNANEDLVLRVFNKVKGLADKIKTKVGLVINRFRGIVGSVGKSITDSLGDLKETLSRGPEAIINAFNSISDHFIQFMVTLTEQMFKFLTSFSSFAQAEGYQISNIDIKIPSLKFEYATMFEISVPLPNIDPPEMTLTINRLNQTSTQE